MQTYKKTVDAPRLEIRYDDNGDIEDSCGGFYDIDDIKEALPDSFKNEDMRDYLKY